MKKILAMTLISALPLWTTAAFAATNETREENRYGQTFLLHKTSNLSHGNIYVESALGSRTGYFSHVNPSRNRFLQGFTGPLARLTVGYGRLLLADYLFGIEGYLSVNHANNQETHYTSSDAVWNHSTKSPLSYGFAITPGYRLSNGDFLYLKPSMQKTRYQLQANASASNNAGPVIEEYTNGHGLAFGYEKAIDLTRSFRMEMTRIVHNTDKANRYPTWEHAITENQFTLGYSIHMDEYNPAPSKNNTLPAHLGVYTGIQGGFGSIKGDYLLINSSSEKLNHLMTGADGTHFGGQVGYGDLFDTRIYMGVEISGSKQSIEAEEVVGNNVVSLSAVSSTVEADLIPGYLWDNNSLALAKVGVTYTHFERPSVATQTAYGPRGDQGPSFSKHVPGFTWGLGYQTALTRDFSIRGLYSHTHYQPFRHTIASTGNHHDWLLQGANLTLAINYLW